MHFHALCCWICSCVVKATVPQGKGPCKWLAAEGRHTSEVHSIQRRLWSFALPNQFLDRWDQRLWQNSWCGKQGANYGFGESVMFLHTDNCTGQNKNSYTMQYLVWHTLTNRHTNITLSFIPVWQTKFKPNWCFGLFKHHVFLPGTGKGRKALSPRRRKRLLWPFITTRPFSSSQQIDSEALLRRSKWLKQATINKEQEGIEEQNSKVLHMCMWIIILQTLQLVMSIILFPQKWRFQSQRTAMKVMRHTHPNWTLMQISYFKRRESNGYLP